MRRAINVFSNVLFVVCILALLIAPAWGVFNFYSSHPPKVLWLAPPPPADALEIPGEHLSNPMEGPGRLMFPQNSISLSVPAAAIEACIIMRNPDGTLKLEGQKTWSDCFALMIRTQPREFFDFNDAYARRRPYWYFKRHIHGRT